MITIFSAHDFTAGAELQLPDAAGQHVRVRRGKPGDEIQLLDGRGAVGRGTIAAVGKRAVTVSVEQVESRPKPGQLIALVPVADRDRMLWAAEKCVELQVTRWQPVVYARSRSVSPRGEGEKFAARVTLRMESALEQSGGAWLPEVKPEMDAADAWREAAGDTRLIFEQAGERVTKMIGTGAVAFAVGPEGGFEKNEVEDALRQGWRSVSLGSTTLRFETAIVAAAAVIRAMQL
jgi:16S rRNA (uracil1498-N3)-methyltransferase